MRLREMLVMTVTVLALASTTFAAKAIPAAIPIEGMTWGGCAAHVREALQTVKGVVEVKPSVEQKLVHVKFDPGKTNVKALVKTINTKTNYRAREPKSTRRASGSGNRGLAVSERATVAKT